MQICGEKASERGHGKALWLDDGVTVAGGSPQVGPANQAAFRELAFLTKFPQQCRDKLTARSQLLP